MVRRSRIRAKMPVLFGASHTHKQGEGKREGTRTASHDQQRGNKRKDNEGRKRAREHTTSRQNKERKTLERGGESTQESNPGTEKEQTAQSRAGNKAKHNSETTEEGRRRGGRRKDRKESVASMPTGGKEERDSAIPKYPGSRPETGEGGCALPVVFNALFVVDSQPAAVL